MSTSPTMSIGDACAVLGVSRWTIRRLIKQGRLEAYKRGPARPDRVEITTESVYAHKYRRPIKISGGDK